jgi:hypothetical protein
MENFNWLWIAFTDLTWWQMVLWAIYVIYFVVRSWQVWDETTSNGIIKGYRSVYFGYKREIRIYHLIRMILDIPCLVVGLFFPLLRKIFAFKIYTFKETK